MFNQPKGIRKPFPYRNLNITFILIGINLFVFFVNYLFPDSRFFLAINRDSFINYKFFWTPITYMFTHGARMNHIIFNMLGLFIFGARLEQKMGSWEFLSFYMICGVVSGLFSLMIYVISGQDAYLIGASGAIFALLLAFAVYYPNAVIYLFFILPIRTKYLVPLYAILELTQEVFGFRDGIAHLTHLAGFGIAILYFYIRLGIDPIKRLRDS